MWTMNVILFMNVEYAELCSEVLPILYYIKGNTVVISIVQLPSIIDTLNK